MPEMQGLSVPHVESILMAEDIRNELSGQISLVGIFGDVLHSRMWPVFFPKLCFMVRVRGLSTNCDHSLILRRTDTGLKLGELKGRLDKVPEPGGLSLFNYALCGAAFAQPAVYVADFLLKEGQDVLVKSEYFFRILNPNPAEFFVECQNCKIKYGSGVVANSSAQIINCGSVCPQCHRTNPLDSKTAFKMPNPEK